MNTFTLDRTQAHLERHSDLLAARLGPIPPLGGLDHAGDGVPGNAGPVDATLQRYGRDYRVRLPAPTMHFCPACLADNGGAWLRDWATRAPAICAVHGTWLVAACPRCGLAPFSAASWLHTDTASWVCPHPVGDQPQSRRRRRRCGLDLREVQTPSASAAERRTFSVLTELATRACGEPQAAVTVCGIATTARDHVDAAYELVDELVGVNASLTGASHPHGLSPGAVSFRRDLVIAQRVLSHATAGGAAADADTVGLLDPAGRHTPLETTSHLRLRRHNPLLAAIRLRSLAGQLSPTAQLTFRVAGPVPRYPAPLDSADPAPTTTALPGQTRLAWIPQVIWPGVLTDWISDDDLTARATASMLLARVGSTRPWHVIALDLGLPADFAAAPPALIRTLRRNGTWTGLLTALDTLATTLEESPPPIDYSARRWAAADLTNMAYAIGYVRMAYPGIASTVPVDTLAAIAWEAYTGGDIRLHRPHTATASTELHTLHHATGQWPSRPDDWGYVAGLVAAVLDQRAGGIDSGPLVWQPP